MARQFWAIAGLAMLLSNIAEAGPRLLEDVDAPPLPAWEEFCKQEPLECKVDVFEPDTLHLTKDIYALLVSVNLAVNRTLTPMTDKHHYGIADLWGYTGDGLGDCEDYQLLKRKLLINAKLPRRALLMTVVIDESGEGHAVLTVRTDRGDLILDNKVNTVREWFEMNYTFVKRESAHKIGWVYLVAEPASAMIASLEK